MPSISAVLLDVGGTLWPGQFRSAEAAGAAQRSQLRNVLARHGPVDRAVFWDRLTARISELDDGSFVQTTASAIRDTLTLHGLPNDPDAVEAIRRAMVLPAIVHLTPFPGVAELLQTIREIGARCVLLSNVTWQDADDYRRAFQSMGFAPYIDAIVTSLETGFLKPHRAMFEAAILAAKCRPEQCVMVGDSEQADIAPAVALGMRAIRVAIEEPPPDKTSAHAVAGSPSEVAAIIRQWAILPS
jgi:FMN phosphatase YigB (HAD superfamily)